MNWPALFAGLAAVLVVSFGAFLSGVAYGTRTRDREWTARLSGFLDRLGVPESER